MSSEQSQSSLSAANSKTLGADFPEVTLPDGSKVQTGTVGALLSNIKTYNTLSASLPNVPPTRPGDRKSIQAQLSALDQAFEVAMPLLNKVGFFELFPPQEWISGSGGEKNPGRKRVGEIAEVWFAEQAQGQGGK